jgi:hypothetical protein
MSPRRPLILTHAGATLPAAAWAARTGIPAQVLYWRKRRGWSDARALTEAVGTRRDKVARAIAALDAQREALWSAALLLALAFGAALRVAEEEA